MGASGKPIFKQLRDSKWLLILFLPTLVSFVLFQYAPMFGLIVAFKDYSVFKGIWDSEWVGLKYFELFFANPDFWPLVRNTFLLGLYSILFGFPAPIILALLLNEIRATVFKRFVQTVSYLPYFISNVVVSSMLLLFLSPDDGMINTFIQWLGFEPIYFMSKPELFRSIYVGSGIWQGIGWGSIIYLAAITSIDPQLYEAAALDGAGRWRKMRHVTLPGIMPVIFILLILEAGGLLATGFEKVYLLYTPLMYSTSDILSPYVSRSGLQQGQFSYATAIGMLNGLVSFLLIIGANYGARKMKQTSLW